MLDVDDGAAGFLVVEGVVLDVAHDLVGLDAAGESRRPWCRRGWDLRRRIRSCGRCGDRGRGRRRRRWTCCSPVAQLAADDGAVEEERRPYPSCRRRRGRKAAGGVVAALRGEANADGGVGQVDAGNAEARDARDVAGAAECSLCGISSAGAEAVPAGAVDEVHLLVEGHFVIIRSARCVGRERGIHPGLRCGFLAGCGGCLRKGEVYGVYETNGEDNASNECGAGEIHECGDPFRADEPVYAAGECLHVPADQVVSQFEISSGNAPKNE